MKFKERFSAAWTALRGISPTQAFLQGSTSAGGSTMTNPLEQSAWVYSCVQFLCRNVSRLPYVVKTAANGGTIVEFGPVVDLFNRPHEYISRTDLWELSLAWLLLRGRCFIAGLDRTGRYVSLRGPLAQVPASLVVLPADRVTPIFAAQYLRGWRYSAAFQDLSPSNLFLPEELIFIAAPNPFHFWGGLAPLEVAWLAAATDRAAGLFQRGLAESNGELGFLVTSDQNLGDEQIAQVKAALAERRKGTGNAARPLFLPNGCKVEKPAITSADAQFLEARKASRQEICAIFGVPEALLGFVENANRSNGEEQHVGFIYNNLAPLVERLDAAFEAIAEIEGLTASHDIDAHPIMVSARRARIDAAVKVCSIGVSFNEANRILDLGFEDQPWGDTWYKPFSLEAVDAPPVPAPAVPPAAPAKTADPFAALAAAFKADRPHECRGSDAFAKAIRAAVSRMRSRSSRFFFDQRTRVLAKLAAKSKAVATALQKGLADELWDGPTEDALLEASLGKLLKDDFAFGSAQAARELGIDFSLAPAKAAEFLAKRRSEIKGINDTTFDRIKAQLDEGLKNGESFGALTERVKEVFTDATNHRAETIAQTEVGIAINSGRFGTMQESGVKYKAWLASNLEGTRPAHLEAEATYTMDNPIPIDDSFLVGGEDLDHPGDPKGSPGNVINCRCTVLAVVGDAQAGYRCLKPTEFLDYRTWAEAGGEK